MLLVDNDELILRSLARLFRHHAVITTARDGASALGLIRDGLDVDVILYDTHVHDMDGRRFYCALTASFPESSVRVVFMNSSVLASDDAEFINAHPTIDKPFFAAELEAAFCKLDPQCGGA